jgi:hypothetical protein
MSTIEELAQQVATLSQRVAASEAVLDLHSLKARYGDLVDRRFVAGAVVDDATMAEVTAAAASLFTADGVWDGGPGLGVATGRPALAERLSRPTLTFARHLFVKPEIRVEGDRAWGRWDLLSPCRRADGQSYLMCGYEDDEYARIDGVWLHRVMKLTTVFMAPVADGWSKILA